MNADLLDNLYAATKHLFRVSYEDLRKTNDDKQFLADALRCEICANTLSLCVELHLDFTDSPVMATSCRSILEAIILLRMVVRDKLSDEQIANYRHQSALLFYGNIFETAKEEKDRFFKDDEVDLIKEKMKWIVEDCDRALETYRKTYDDKFNERASRDAIREGLFFTYRKPSDRDKLKFSKLFNVYLNELDTSHTLYDRISFFAHPWYLDNLKDIALVRQIRLKDVGVCLEAVCELFTEEMKSFQDAKDAIKTDLNTLGPYMQRSQTIKSIFSFSKLREEAGKSATKLSFTALCFAFLRDALAEMNLMIGLGFPEMALSKFQSVAEFWSMNALLNNANGPKEFTALHRAFDYSTRVQIHNLGGFDKLGLKGEQVLREAFDSAFEKPSIPFEEYKANISKNSLLFLKGEPVQKAPTFLDMVRLGTEIAFPPEHSNEREGFVLSYLFSIDVHHATGFCYAENRDCWLSLSHVGLKGIYQSIWVFAMLMALSSEDPEVIPLCKGIIELVNAETEELSNLNLKYPE